MFHILVDVTFDKIIFVVLSINAKWH